MLCPQMFGKIYSFATSSDIISRFAHSLPHLVLTLFTCLPSNESILSNTFTTTPEVKAGNITLIVKDYRLCALKVVRNPRNLKIGRWEKLKLSSSAGGLFLCGAHNIAITKYP